MSASCSLAVPHLLELSPVCQSVHSAGLSDRHTVTVTHRHPLTQSAKVVLKIHRAAVLTANRVPWSSPVHGWVILPLSRRPATGDPARNCRGLCQFTLRWSHQRRLCIRDSVPFIFVRIFVEVSVGVFVRKKRSKFTKFQNG